MAMIVTVQDDQDPYSRTGRATQREDGTWDVEYFRPGGLGSPTSDTYGDLIGVQVLDVDHGIPADEGYVVAFMVDTLADRTDAFSGIYPDAGYQRNRGGSQAGVCSHDPRNVLDDDTGAYLGDECGDCGQWLSGEVHAQ